MYTISPSNPASINNSSLPATNTSTNTLFNIMELPLTSFILLFRSLFTIPQLHLHRDLLRPIYCQCLIALILKQLQVTQRHCILMLQHQPSYNLQIPPPPLPSPSILHRTKLSISKSITEGLSPLPQINYQRRCR